MADTKLNPQPGETLLKALLADGVSIAHECGGTLACATCCVVVREGLDTLSPPSEDELDMLERSGAGEPGARLACQAVAAGGEVVVAKPSLHIPARTAGALPVSITVEAAKHLGRQLARHRGAVAVRLSVEPSGCSGFGYRVDPAHGIRDDDTVFEQAGVRIAVDPVSLPYLQGATVDLVKEGLARRLRFDNPNARQSCGCGESFSA
jgi:iron-sulfur cluster assembly protein